MRIVFWGCYQEINSDLGFGSFLLIVKHQTAGVQWFGTWKTNLLCKSSDLQTEFHLLDVFGNSL